MSVCKKQVLRLLHSSVRGSFTTDRRLAHPARMSRIDSGGSPTGAIAEYCRECLQTHRDADDCTAYECPLWPYRPVTAEALRTRPVGYVPSQEQYAELIREQDPDGSKAAAARERFAAVRARAGAQADATPTTESFEVPEETDFVF